MFNFRPNFIPNKFVIIGGGGTGGRLVPLIVQFLKTATWIHEPKVFILDFDKVEDKNLVRQNFIKLDLGRFKAQVLAERYGRAFDIDVTAINHKVLSASTSGSGYSLTPDDVMTGRGLRLHELTNAVVFMCVDSMEARKAILSHLVKSSAPQTLLVIDAGNENDYGQVLLYNPISFTASASYAKLGGMDNIPLENDILPIDVNTAFLSLPAQFYVETNDRVAAVSCAELDQTLAINALMATSIMGITQNFLYSKPIQFNRLNVSLTNGAIPDYYSFRQLKDSVFDSYNAAGYQAQLSRILGRFPHNHDVTPLISEIEKKMNEFKAKQLGGRNAPPPLTEITKKKKAKEPA